MRFPIEYLLILFKSKGYDIEDAGAVRRKYNSMNLVLRDIREREESAEILNNFINSELTSRGFDSGESVEILRILDSLSFLSDPIAYPTGSLPQSRTEIEEPAIDESAINVVGKFMMSNEDGTNRHYEKNDVVYYEGKTYIATDDVMGWVPESMHPDNKWAPIDLVDNTIDGEEF